jgi:hypothetical protein
VNELLVFGTILKSGIKVGCGFTLIEVKYDRKRICTSPGRAFLIDVSYFSQLVASIRFVQKCSQALAIQGPGMVASNWPDWVILPYIIGAELTVE